ncbi:unnamed protein product [Phytomonas sp. Hart1]|nr:unnamed protein product [Phytomonas sp. Hart1]|eukprot:CCW72333.1 unnamed protein product [Phytomonas sp. isolate Hart1]
MNPCTRESYGSVMPSPLCSPFASWRVLLLASQPFVINGISAVLRAGGCSYMHSFVFNGGSPGDPEEATKPHIVDLSACGLTKELCVSSQLGDDLLKQCSHILVECATVSETSTTGHFNLPPWFPNQLRCPAYYPRIFTLELMYHCLCVSSDDLFDASGAVINEALISDACRVEPFS